MRDDAAAAFDAHVAFTSFGRPPTSTSCKSSNSAPLHGGHVSQQHSHRSDRVLDLDPVIRRRMTHATTSHTLDTLDAPLDEDQNAPKWTPGSEPTTDSTAISMVWCQFTVAEFSNDRAEVRHDFNNHTFLDFLRQPQQDWVQCRWISVTGLSRDVVNALGEKYGLHELALEDLVGVDQAYSRNLTKADW